MEKKPTNRIARVAFDSPLPNLDRLFDYECGELAPAPGSRVRVPFGRSKNLIEGFIVDLVDDSEFLGSLASVAEVISDVPVLAPHMYSFLRALADRQASTLGELLKVAVPKRSVNVEKKFIAEQSGYGTVKNREKGNLETKLAAPRDAAWAIDMTAFASKQIADGYSALLLVPDFRDLAILKNVLQTASQPYIDLSTDRKPSERYSGFLNCLKPGAHVVIGSRNSVYAPILNLGGIAMYDDADDLFVEPTSPYLHSRDAALVRQSLTNCDLLFVSNYRSTEVQRLVELNFLKDTTSNFTKPQVAVSDDNSKLPTMAWQAIRECVYEAKQPVLIQVLGKGVARSAYCKECSARAKCGRCHGPIWIDASGAPRCRWCSALNHDFKCDQCSSTTLRQGAGGATRTVAEIGKSFPGIPIQEANGDDPTLRIKPGARIVISTPGAEPEVEGGYGLVVILDAQAALNRDTLRAQDIALRNWTNAIAKLAKGGRAVVSGVSGELAKNLALWQLDRVAHDELENRRELEFPPHLRLASIQGERSATAKMVEQLQVDGFQPLGPIQLKSDRNDLDNRYVVKYGYADGAKLAQSMRTAIAKLTGGATRVSTSGRTVRAIKVRMDDPEVI